MNEQADVRRRLIHIHECRGAGWKTIAKFLQADATLASIFTYSQSEFIKRFSMTGEYAKRFYEDLHTINVAEKLDLYRRRGIEIVTRFDDRYPPLLKHIFDPPWVLYCRGNVSLFQQSDMLSVIGTRNPSSYGLKVLRHLLLPLVRSGRGIVSGLAEGIDSAAHRLALQSATIAVLGSGLFHVYPKSERDLFEQIGRSHLLISEFPPDTPARPWQFPLRNRIISGLTKGTLVVEARERSGTLITADQALEQGRDVYAVPGSVFEPRSAGTNHLIQQGARLVTDASDLQ
ncbi:MAG TPA: DNA-processing protein DprA [Bacillales bacterium]|nr:DNA-processing protein DprA [Bacillales bacterium]